MKQEKLPKGVYRRNKASDQLWITYHDENGKKIKESAHTIEPYIAKAFLNKRLLQVAEHKLIPTRQYESITVGEILDFWWERHGQFSAGFNTRCTGWKSSAKSRRGNLCRRR